jgi:hypothetical protein
VALTAVIELFGACNKVFSVGLLAALQQSRPFSAGAIVFERSSEREVLVS